MARSAHLAAALVLGFGATHASAAEGLDPVGDVTSPNADIVAVSAVVAGGMLELQARFAAPPFQGAHTHTVIWYFDTDQNPATTRSGLSFPGADVFLMVDGPIGQHPQLSGIPGVEDYFPGFEESTSGSTFMLLFPVSLLDDGRFNYFLESNFGGSFGLNDFAPDQPDFHGDGFFRSDFGPPACGTLGIDIQPGSPLNVIGGRRSVPVALLSSDMLDAGTEIVQESLTFGVTGSEPSWIGCRPRPVDVNADGLLDLICFFNLAETGFQQGDTEGHLKAVTTGGGLLCGSDAVRLIRSRALMEDSPVEP